MFCLPDYLHGRTLVLLLYFLVVVVPKLNISGRPPVSDSDKREEISDNSRIPTGTSMLVTSLRVNDGPPGQSRRRTLH